MNIYYTIAILIATMIFLVSLSSWFSGAEVALTRLSRAQLGQLKLKKQKKVKHLVLLKSNMDRTLVTILIANNLVNISLVLFVAFMVNRLFHNLGLTLLIAMFVFLLIVFGEIIFKATALQNTEKICLKRAGVIRRLSTVLFPLSALFLKLSKLVVKHPKTGKAPLSLFSTEESIKELAVQGVEDGELSEEQREIIHKAFSFGKITVEETMIPMKKVFYLPGNYSVDQAQETLVQYGFTRVPITNKDEEIVGVLHSKALLGKSEEELSSLATDPFVVSAGSLVGEAFQKMREAGTHLALVEEEKGDYLGIITMEDLLEQLVGEITDEYSPVKEKTRRRGGD